MDDKKQEYIEQVEAARRRAIRTPKCCATCENLKDDGLCSVHNMYPPLDKLEVELGCKQWIIYIPF